MEKDWLITLILNTIKRCVMEKEELCISKGTLEDALIELIFAKLREQDLRCYITRLAEDMQEIFNFVGE